MNRSEEDERSCGSDGQDHGRFEVDQAASGIHSHECMAYETGCRSSISLRRDSVFRMIPRAVRIGIVCSGSGKFPTTSFHSMYLRKSVVESSGRVTMLARMSGRKPMHDGQVVETDSVFRSNGFTGPNQ